MEHLSVVPRAGAAFGILALFPMAAAELAGTPRDRNHDLPSRLLTMSLRPPQVAAAIGADLFVQVVRELNRIVLTYFRGNARQAAQFLGREYKSFVKTLKRLQLDQFAGGI